MSIALMEDIGLPLGSGAVAAWAVAARAMVTGQPRDLRKNEQEYEGKADHQEGLDPAGHARVGAVTVSR